MRTTSVTRLRTRCSTVLADVASTGRPILVVRRGQAIARIEPPCAAPPSWWGRHRGVVRIVGDIVGDIVAPCGAQVPPRAAPARRGRRP
ncbi:MAG: type II toxin-antitoxin system Phd/YefM family antitoxin [Planctomycetia bacterium]|nr:type II toxin-antitoxin system Phd/YefM family antitoxin [Planctomycetia bacterium]